MDEERIEPTESAPKHADAAGTGQDEPLAIDIEALAEKVYRLMLAEIRLDRARGLSPEDGG